MAYQIVKVRKEYSSAGGFHSHIVAVQLTDGTALTVAHVVGYLNQGVEFYTYANGYRARVYAPTCWRCKKQIITTSADATTANNLDNLPQF